VPELGWDVRRRRLPTLAAVRGGDDAPTLAAMARRRCRHSGCDEARAEGSDGAAASHAGHDGEEPRAESSAACCDGDEREVSEGGLHGEAPAGTGEGGASADALRWMGRGEDRE
jgi:hypothetical protein